MLFRSFSSSWKMSARDLQTLIERTSFAVSTEESRPILNGVLWQLRPEETLMVATNGHRLARMGVPASSSGAPSADFIVPPAALQQVQRLFKDAEELEVAQDGNHLGFRSGDIGTRCGRCHRTGRCDRDNRNPGELRCGREAFKVSTVSD